MTSQRSRPISKSKWFIPAASAVAGLAILGASWLGGQPGAGLAGLAIMVAFGAFVLLAGSRSETIRGLRGDGRDERFAMIDLRATAFSGLATIIALIVAFLVSIARGQSGSPYDWLGAVAGLAYIAGVVFLRLRG